MAEELGHCFTVPANSVFALLHNIDSLRTLPAREVETSPDRIRASPGPYIGIDSQLGSSTLVTPFRAARKRSSLGPWGSRGRPPKGWHGPGHGGKRRGLLLKRRPPFSVVQVTSAALQKGNCQEVSNR